MILFKQVILSDIKNSWSENPHMESTGQEKDDLPVTKTAVNFKPLTELHRELHAAHFNKG